MDSRKRKRSVPFPILVRRALSRVPLLPVFAALSFTAMLGLLGVIGWLLHDTVRTKVDPNWTAYDKHIWRGTPKPLVDQWMNFRLAVSVFARKPDPPERIECTPEWRAAWEGWWKGRMEIIGSKKVESDPGGNFSATLDRLGEWRGMGWDPCEVLYVPEVEELWSGTVTESLWTWNKGSQRAEADIEVDIPAATLAAAMPERDWPLYRSTAEDVYAVVTLIPSIRSLSRARWYKQGLPDVPYLGTGLQSHLDDITKRTTPENATEARTVLESLSVRVPLLKRESGRLSVTKDIQAILLRQTKPLKEAVMHDHFERLAHEGCKFRHGEKRHRLLCLPETYDHVGYGRAVYVDGYTPPPKKPERPKEPEWPENFEDLEDAEDTEDLEWPKIVPHLFEPPTARYPPYMFVPEPGPKDWVDCDAEPSSGGAQAMHHKIKFRFSVVGPKRLAMLEKANHRNAPGSDAEHQREQDRIELAYGLLGVRGGARSWVRAVSHVAALAAGLLARFLTVVYWSTRTTTAGISMAGTVLLVAGEVVRNVAFKWDYYFYAWPRWFFWLTIAFVLLLPEVFQLRTIWPFELDGRLTLEGLLDGLKVAIVPKTSREEKSAGRDLNAIQIGALAVVATLAQYALYVKPVRVVRGTHGSHLGPENDPPWPYYKPKPSYLPAPVWSKMSLLPPGQGLVTTGRVAQLIMNYRSGTYAGNLALTSVFRLIELADHAVAFFASETFYDGLYLAAAGQAVLILVEAYQAWKYPRIDQHAEDDDDGLAL